MPEKDSPQRAGSEKQRSKKLGRCRGNIAFAHRGGFHHLPGGGFVTENTIEAFEKAIAKGAGGIEGDVWTTADGECVVYHDAVVRTGAIPRPIWMTRRDALPGYVPTIEEVYESCGTSVDVSLDCRSRRAGELAIDAARSASGEAPGRLWLCSFIYSDLAAWRRKSEEVKLVDSTPFHRPRWLLERRIAKAASAGLDAFNAHHSAWSEALVDKAHELGLTALAWDVNDRASLERVRDMGIDGIYSDELSLVIEFQGDGVEEEG